MKPLPRLKEYAEVFAEKTRGLLLVCDLLHRAVTLKITEHVLPATIQDEVEGVRRDLQHSYDQQKRFMLDLESLITASSGDAVPVMNDRFAQLTSAQDQITDRHLALLSKLDDVR